MDAAAAAATVDGFVTSKDDDEFVAAVFVDETSFGGGASLQSQLQQLELQRAKLELEKEKLLHQKASLVCRICTEIPLRNHAKCLYIW